MKTGKQYLDYRFEELRNEYSSWRSHHQELNRNFQPRRGRFNASDRNKGHKRNQLPNNTPLFAKRVLASGLMTGVTSPARPWFKLNPPDPDMADYGPVRSWLDEVQDVLYSVFAKSGLYRALPAIYQELGVIGTAAMIQDEDFENICSWTPFTAGEYYLGMNGNRVVDTFAREFEMTTYQVISRFGLENVSHNVRIQYENNNLMAPVDVYHLIEPNEGDDRGFKVNDKFKFRSVYYEPSTREAGEDKYLSVKGYYEFPVYAPRWDTNPGDTYGISPGMDALGDSFALQTQEKESGKAIAKMVSPPMKAPSSMRNTQVSLLPGATNFTDDPNNSFRSIYDVNIRLGELEQKIDKTEDRVNRAFYVDLFMMISNMQGIQPRNIKEIAERQEEKLLQLGPVLENMNDELLDLMITRTFNMIVRASEPGWKGITDFMVIPPPPEELSETDLKVEYISILAQAQKMVKTGAVERWIGFVGNMASLPGKEGALDKVNEDEIANIMALDLGVPNKAVRTQDEAEEIRNARRKQAAQAETREMIGQGAEAAKTLSQADTTGGNVLSEVLGVGR